MTAAVYAARKKVNTLLLTTDIGGQANRTTGVENYMGYQFIEGFELMNKFSEQMKQFPIEVKIGIQVNSISKNANGFEIVTDGQTFLSQTVIVASGKKPRSLNVTGEEQLVGRGVTYCAICDGPLFAGSKVAVVGGGNSALAAANDMIKIAEQIYLISVTPLTGDPVLIEKVRLAANLTIFEQNEVLEIKGDKFVKGIKIRDINTGDVIDLEVSGVFIEIGLMPNSTPVKGLVKLNQVGEIEVNCMSETSMPGIYAAGDVTDVPDKQIVIAAGEGAKAALEANRYLQKLRVGAPAK